MHRKEPPAATKAMPGSPSRMLPQQWPGIGDAAGPETKPRNRLRLREPIFMSDQTKFQKRIPAALHGVEPFDPDKHKDVPQELKRLLAGQREPVSRFLKLALTELHGRKLHTGDKIEWKAYVVFRGSVWYIHDWKQASWTLNGPSNAESDMKLLLKKFEAAAKVAEAGFEAKSKEKIAAGEFALAHQLWMLQSNYWILRKQAEAMLGMKCEPEPGVVVSTFKLPTGGSVTEPDMPGTNAYFAKRRDCEASAAGAVVLLFGTLELVFDACFAFGNRNGLTYQQFRRKDWKERFRLSLMDVSPADMTRVTELNSNPDCLASARLTWARCLRYSTRQLSFSRTTPRPGRR
jgi:hypothetical protein